MPKISIIIPVYNAEQYLEECLLSISQQTFGDFEILAINDGSTDRSLEILKKHQEKEPRLKVFSQENKGVSVARNLGLENAQGKYISFVDADDFIKENYLENLLQIMEYSAEVDMSVCGFIGSEIRNVEKNKIEINSANIKIIIELFNRFLLFTPVCKFYKKEIISNNKLRFIDGLNIAEDLLFNIEYLKRIRVIETTDYIGYHYRILNDSLSKKISLEKFITIEKSIKEIEAFFLNITNHNITYINYVNKLKFWNTYDALHALLNNKNNISNNEIKIWIKTILKFQYFEKSIYSKEKKSLLMKVCDSKNPLLIYLFIKLR